MNPLNYQRVKYANVNGTSIFQAILWPAMANPGLARNPNVENSGAMVKLLIFQSHEDRGFMGYLILTIIKTLVS